MKRFGLVSVILLAAVCLGYAAGPPCCECPCDKTDLERDLLPLNVQVRAQRPTLAIRRDLAQIQPREVTIGSGVLYRHGEECVVLTNHHVIAEWIRREKDDGKVTVTYSPVQVLTADGELKCEILHADKKLDVGVLKPVTGAAWGSWAVMHEGKLALGEVVWGCTNGRQDGQITKSWVSKMRGKGGLSEGRLVLGRTSFAPGSSGGGAYVERDGRLRLVGLVMGGDDALAYAVPAEHLTKALKDYDESKED